MEKKSFKDFKYKLIVTKDNDVRLSIYFLCEGDEFILYYFKEDESWLLSPRDAYPKNPFYLLLNIERNKHFGCDAGEFPKFLFKKSNLRLKFRTTLGMSFLETLFA